MATTVDGSASRLMDPASELDARRISRPRLYHPQHVPRPRLIELLERGQGGGLTLLFAPAGFGKTTLLSAWSAASSRPVAWLTVAQTDNDPLVFARDLVAAIRKVAPDFGGGVLRLLQLPELPPADVVASVIAGEGADLPDELVLVLDDYEVIADAGVHAVVGELVQRLPGGLRVVLASRHRPALRSSLLRARGQLVELGPRSCAFDRTRSGRSSRR